LIEITTVTPGSSLAPSEPTNATWAAFRDTDGSWKPLAPVSFGRYVFQTRADPWAVVFACSDGQSALVFMDEDTGNKRGDKVTLEEWCARVPPSPFTLSGTFSHVAVETGWLDFGYALELRGAVLPINGATASYEEVNVAAGIWDFAFGLRKTPSAPFSKIAFVRGLPLSQDTTLDIDVNGPTAIVPEAKRLQLHGIDPAKETVSAPVYYTTNGGTRGLDLGPQSIPSLADLDLTYATIPQSARSASDSYAFGATAQANDDTTTRQIVATFSQAKDLDFTFEPPLPQPHAAKVAGATGYPRLTAHAPGLVSADQASMTVRTPVSNRQLRVWRIQVGAAQARGPMDLTLPDLSAVEGFDVAWALPTNRAHEVTTTVEVHTAAANHLVSYTEMVDP
jgi:hypothetical protein